MYFLDRFGPPYIGMGIETSIPMYRLLKPGPPYIGMALNRTSPMYIPKTIHYRYIGIQQKYQIPMYPKKEYIGVPQKQAIPMYLSFQTPQKYSKLLKNTPNLSKKATRVATYLILQANLRANHSEVDTRGSMLRGKAGRIARN